jgi:hypothetical protein
MKKSTKDAVKDGVSAEELAAIREKLRDALPPLNEMGGGAELRRDLWPEMLLHLGQPEVRVPWFDWALLATAGAATIFFPALIPALLYHL